MSTQEFRQKFLDYFRKQEHRIVPSSPVVPHEDPTLLFINAGMNQFKDVFLGEDRRDYTRATTSQKCIRAGGKHNDLENVGHTKRHLTFFEMLGNFSFGDYFKEEAIRFAWECSTEVFGIDPDLIWPTIYLDDEEAYELWKSYVPVERICRFGEEDNFWAMGDTGPCGPCSELHFDRGKAFGEARNPHEDTSGERYLEFWNLVFMQFNRDAHGNMTALPKPSIDTGMGLERLVALKMGVDNVFETDVLRGLMAQVENLSGVKFDPTDLERAPAFRVIADHLRTLSFAIADGAQPSNVDRGYVLRKILRRAVRYGRMLGFEKPFLADVLPRLVDTMSEAYPELKSAQGVIGEVLTIEEESFLRTLKRGGNLLNQIIAEADQHGHQIKGDEAFKLKDTYGMPLEEIQLLAKDAGLSVDLNGYRKLEEEARERSRQAHKKVQQVSSENLFEEISQRCGSSAFLGYTKAEGHGTVKALVRDGESVDQLDAGEEGMVILDETPFYAEMGGQVGDTGEISTNGTRFAVTDCQAPFKGIIAHLGTLEDGSLKVGDTVTASVDVKRRREISNNHSATHLLHWALCKVLGEHVRQAGSVVNEYRLRFDFSHHKALSKEELRQIEDMVNDQIRANPGIDAYELPYEDVQKRQDIKQFFGEKYGSDVRVVEMGASKELCGGIHTSATGNIGLFRIAKESSIAAGVRRIEAVTGHAAEEFARESENLIDQLAEQLKSQPKKLVDRINRLVEENRDLAKALKEAAAGKLDEVIQEMLKNQQVCGGVPVIAGEVPLEPKELKDCAERAAQQFSEGVIILAAQAGGKCSILVRVADSLVSSGLKANDLMGVMAPIIEAKGGGKPQQAQAGGGQVPQKIPEAIATGKEWLCERGEAPAPVAESSTKEAEDTSDKGIDNETLLLELHQLMERLASMGLQPPAEIIDQFRNVADRLDMQSQVLDDLKKRFGDPGSEPSKSPENKTW